MNTAQLDLKVEIPRRKSQARRILEMLQARPNGQCTNIDFQRIAFNYTMRISELRKDGHKIESKYVRSGVHRYFYKGQSER